MKLTIDNYKGVVFEHDCILMHALLIDLEELNNELEKQNQSNKKLFIDFIDKHTIYSPERVDPCPDYYGMYRLVFEKNPCETVGTEMNIKELDDALCILINFIEFNN